jgi:hypothetical protein
MADWALIFRESAKSSPGEKTNNIKRTVQQTIMGRVFLCIQ